MKRDPHKNSPPFSEEDVRIARKLICTDKDRSEAMNAYLGGMATHFYEGLSEKEIYDLSSDELIFVYWYRLGLARRSDGDDDIALEDIAVNHWDAIMRRSGAGRN